LVDTFYLILSTTMAVVISACTVTEQRAEETSVAATDTNYELASDFGEAVYQNHCAACHDTADGED